LGNDSNQYPFEKLYLFPRSIANSFLFFESRIKKRVETRTQIHKSFQNQSEKEQNIHMDETFSSDGTLASPIKTVSKLS